MQMKGTTLSLGSAQRLIEPKTYDVHKHVVIPAVQRPKVKEFYQVWWMHKHKTVEKPYSVNWIL